VRQQSLALAERLAGEAERADSELVQEAYLRILGRPAREQEIARASGFIGEFTASYAETANADLLLAATSSQEVSANADDAAEAAVVPENPDDIDRTPTTVKEEAVQPKNAREAAWMSFIQALYASAEFRFVR